MFTGGFTDRSEMVCSTIPPAGQSLYSGRMSYEPSARSSAEGQLRIQAQGSDRLLQAGLSYRIGRDPDADIVVPDPRVSWQHAVVSRQDDGWQLQDSSSTNGTFVNGQRVRHIAITGDCAIRLGHPDTGPLLSCSMEASEDGGRGGAAGVKAATARWTPEQPPAARVAAPAPAAEPGVRSSGGRSRSE